MKIEFKLPLPLIGFAPATVRGGERDGDVKTEVIYRELLQPDAPLLSDRLENLQKSLFGFIPDLANPAMTQSLLVQIAPDGSCIAHVEEAKLQMTVKTTRAVRAGEPALPGDIQDVQSVAINVEIPPECGVVSIVTAGWRRTLWFDFGPLQREPEARLDLATAMAQQWLALMNVAIPEEPSRVVAMAEGLRALRQLLSKGIDKEEPYQELLEEHPWMLGGIYEEILRHENVDNGNIPDFTARRSGDKSHDVVELKQPFLKLFNQDNKLSAKFNDSWNQCERYLEFVTSEQSYLRDRKGLTFSYPIVVLLMGYQLSSDEERAIRAKRKLNQLIRLQTYDELVEQAAYVLQYVQAATL